ncbi:beta-galactosidase 13 [Nicotiana tabacum]|uniref:Beta-galactosidase n=1 Tax=Nicotiana tabacum TaxID=4097 RepID=A0A1S4BA85_TOBAC|nr:beta-galactosidase 13-like [Nicotiana tomentosiformis]XP_016485821.1 PREDICTED: beta-galactosidase 13-like [Nicotiana tabacum]
MAISSRLLSLALLSLLVSSAIGEKTKGVTYDGRSMIVNGERELLFSGSIHYPRMPPEMWPDIIRKAKEGGLNLIQTYVFWNIHEPVQGQFNFEGNYDVVKFIKTIGEQGLYVTLRIGPYIEAEWNQGGFPYWLREVPNITFRSYNEPFIHHMKKYSEMVIDLMKKEKLFAPQGGPIIMAQIENEYNNVQLAYRDNGKKYVEWAANMATGLYNGVPWIMCKQKDAPAQVINTCNGRHCADTFTGPNGPNKPSLWTENWTAQYRTFGDPPSQRAAEDIAFSVARFFAKNGTLTNYYMYYGGTNYGRTGSSFVTTRYYDEAPLDEFGLYREPKWSHLRDLHRALRLSRRALLWGTPSVQKINQNLEITVYEKPGSDCAAFLTNNHTTLPATIKFRGKEYYLPEKSVSILPDCKTVVYNTQTIVSQHNSRNFLPSEKAKNLKWEMYQEKVPTISDLPLKNREPLELYSLTKDTSDYAWYSTSINFDRHDLPMRPDILPVLQIASMGHALSAFVNGEFVGFGHGNNIEKSFVFQKPVILKPGTNTISILAETVGFPNSGAYMEKRFAGPRGVTVQGLMSGTLDITLNNWGHEVGVFGEKEQLFTEEGAKKVKWTPVNGPTKGAVTWYKTYFDAPEGNNPVALKMDKMQKGMMWVNGNSLGRYWSSFLSPLGQPTQYEYHIPRAFLKPKNNLLVIFEETGGLPETIEVQTVNRDTICSIITEYHPPHVKSWGKSGTDFVAIVEDLKSGAHLTCPDNKIIEKVEFASYGNPDGACGNLYNGNCTSINSLKVAERHCLGKNTCTIPIERQVYDEPSNDPCPNIFKTLAVQMKCGNKN